MISLEKFNPFISWKILKDFLWMFVAYHSILGTSHNEKAPIFIFLIWFDYLWYFQLCYIKIRLLFDIRLNTLKNTRKNTMKQATTDPRHKLLGSFPTKLPKRTKRRISNNNLTLRTEENSNSAHTSAPGNNSVTLWFEEFGSDVYVGALFLS